MVGNFNLGLWEGTCLIKTSIENIISYWIPRICILICWYICLWLLWFNYDVSHCIKFSLAPTCPKVKWGASTLPTFKLMAHVTQLKQCTMSYKSFFGSNKIDWLPSQGKVVEGWEESTFTGKCTMWKQGCLSTCLDWTFDDNFCQLIMNTLYSSKWMLDSWGIKYLQCNPPTDSTSYP